MYHFSVNNNMSTFLYVWVSLTAMYLYFLPRLYLSVLGLAIRSAMCVLPPWTQSWKLGPLHSHNIVKAICYILLL